MKLKKIAPWGHKWTEWMWKLEISEVGDLNFNFVDTGGSKLMYSAICNHSLIRSSATAENYNTVM